MAARKREIKQEPTQSIELVQPEALQSYKASTIQDAIMRLENVRRFITKGLNTGYARELKKIGKRKPTEAEEKKLKSLEIDFGTIPGVNRKFLLQPGAEKLCLWLRVRPVYETSVEAIPDKPGHIDVVSRCRLMASGSEEEVFSGPLASCTTMESNFRFVWVKLEPPPTYEWAMKEGRIGKEMGTHRSFKKDDKWVWMERKENPNIYDKRNPVRQMAEKRALVKAIRNFGAMSEIFTEDPTEWVLDDQTNVTEDDAPPAVPGSVVKAEEPPQQGDADKSVEIRWPSDSADVAVIKLPDLAGGADLASKIMDFADYIPELRAWHCPAVYVPDVAKLAAELGLRVVEIDQQPAAAPPPPPPAPPPVTAVPPTGTVTLVRKEPGVNKRSPYYVIICGGRTLYCYRQHLFAPLSGSKGQECEFAIEQGAYPKITDIKRIGPVEFHEGLPVVQREAQ